MTRLLTIIGACALGLGAPAAAVAVPFDAFARPVVPVAAGPPNGDFAQGLNGWSVAGPRPPQVRIEGAHRFVRLDNNTTIRSTPIHIPPRAQVLAITTRAASRGGVLRVSVQRSDGRVIRLGVIVPGRGFAVREVGIGPVAGRTVSILLDPILGLGRSIDVKKVGPQRVVAGGWWVSRGAPQRVGGGRIYVATGRLSMRSSSAPVRRGAELSLEARGSGWVRLTVGTRRRAVRLHARRWQRLSVRAGRSGRVRVTMIADPGSGQLLLRRFSHQRAGADQPPLG